jgi:DJ-1/pfpI family protein
MMRAVNVCFLTDLPRWTRWGLPRRLSLAREGERKCYEIEYFSVEGGLVGSSTGAKIWTRKLDEIAKFGVFLVPGGFAARELAHDSEFIAALGELA